MWHPCVFSSFTFVQCGLRCYPEGSAGVSSNSNVHKTFRMLYMSLVLCSCPYR